jgi:hypothetical protein
VRAFEGVAQAVDVLEVGVDHFGAGALQRLRFLRSAACAFTARTANSPDLSARMARATPPPCAPVLPLPVMIFFATCVPRFNVRVVDYLSTTGPLTSWMSSTHTVPFPSMAHVELDIVGILPAFRKEWCLLGGPIPPCRKGAPAVRARRTPPSPEMNTTFQGTPYLHTFGAQIRTVGEACVLDVEVPGLEQAHRGRSVRDDLQRAVVVRARGGIESHSGLRDTTPSRIGNRELLERRDLFFWAQAPNTRHTPTAPTGRHVHRRSPSTPTPRASRTIHPHASSW